MTVSIVFGSWLALVVLPLHYAASQPPVLTTFALNNGAEVVARDAAIVLTHTVVGAAPSSYRVSARADFAGAAWVPYTRHIELRPIDLATTAGCEVPRASRRLRVFLQVRAPLGDEVRIVNGQRTLVPRMSESNVLADSICVSERAPG